MRLARFYHKFLSLGLCAIVFWAPYKMASATTLNFSATLTNVTCSIRLDKSTLALGDVMLSDLRPETLVKPQSFSLAVENCVGNTGGTDKPIVVIRGEGVTQDNKWLFRNAESANKVGIVVIRSDSQPLYSQSEIKNGTAITLANAGQVPVAQTYTFFAGASCGGVTGCTAVGSGAVSASLYFTFEYE